MLAARERLEPVLLELPGARSHLRPGPAGRHVRDREGFFDLLEQKKALIRSSRPLEAQEYRSRFGLDVDHPGRDRGVQPHQGAERTTFNSP